MAIKVTGRQLLRAQLATLPKTVRGKLQEQLTASAEALAEEMRARAPVDSGALKQSIRVEPFSRGGIGAVVLAGGPLTTKSVRNGVDVAYDYAVGIELGTQEMLASPFFYPTYRRAKAKINRRSAKAVKAAVEGTS
jgi:HK97 gp10 family phage protein